MEYIPQRPNQPSPPQPAYELKQDVTGKPPPIRGPQIIKAIRYNNEGKKETIELKVPFAPKTKCKKCHGRGYIGFDVNTDNIILCIKCYPQR